MRGDWGFRGNMTIFGMQRGQRYKRWLKCVGGIQENLRLTFNLFVWVVVGFDMKVDLCCANIS